MRRETGMVSYYEYDTVRRLTKEQIVDSSLQQLYAFEYSFDDAGNRTYMKLTFGDATEVYYEYDAANALTRRHTLASGAGRTAGWAYYEYNDNGSLTSYKDESGSEWAFGWDDNQLCHSIVPSSGSPAYFYYDGRLTRYAMDEGKGINGSTYFSWDGINILQTQKLSAAPINAFRDTITHGATPIAGIGSVVEQKREGLAATTLYLHNDHRGTTYKITDATGAETWSGLTDAYGTELHESGASPSIYWYQGEAWYRHVLDGLVLYVSPTRLYMPEDGRFTERDPLQRSGSIDLEYEAKAGRNDASLAPSYGLGGARVLSTVDPTGLQPNIVSRVTGELTRNNRTAGRPQIDLRRRVRAGQRWIRRRLVMRLPDGRGLWDEVLGETVPHLTGFSLRCRWRFRPPPGECVCNAEVTNVEVRMTLGGIDPGGITLAHEHVHLSDQIRVTQWLDDFFDTHSFRPPLDHPMCRSRLVTGALEDHLANAVNIALEYGARTMGRRYHQFRDARIGDWILIDNPPNDPIRVPPREETLADMDLYLRSTFRAFNVAFVGMEERILEASRERIAFTPFVLAEVPPLARVPVTLRAGSRTEFDARFER